MTVNTTVPGRRFAADSLSTVQLEADDCPAPSESELGCVYYNDQDFWQEECYRRRLWVHLPVWLFALCSVYAAAMLVRDAAKSKARGTYHRREKYAKLLKISRVFAACCTACTLTYDGALIFVENAAKGDCNLLRKAENGLYWITLSAIYVVLWTRQRVIFSQPGLHGVSARGMSFMSFATIFLVTALPMANFLMFSIMAWSCLHPVLRICTVQDFNDTIWVGQYIVPILLPITLLVLLSWPLVQHHRKLSRNAPGRKSAASVLRRIILATVACLFTDAAAITCNGRCYLIVSFVLRQLSVFSNLVSMMVSFADWKCILFPALVKKTSDAAESASAPTTTSCAEKTRTRL